MSTMRQLIEARSNDREPVAVALRNATGDLEVWVVQLAQRLTREIGGGVRFLGGYQVAKGVGDAIEAVISLGATGERPVDETMRQAANWLKGQTKSTWASAERYGKPALVATYDL